VDPGSKFTNVYSAGVSQAPGTTVGATMNYANSTGSIVLTNPGNQISTFYVGDAQSAQLVTTVPNLNLSASTRGPGGIQVSNYGGAISIGGGGSVDAWSGGGSVVLFASGNLGLDATYSSRYISSTSTVTLNVGGNLALTSSASNKSYITAPVTQVNFASASGLATFDGVQAAGTTAANGIGFYAAGSPAYGGTIAVLGSSLLVSSGDPLNFVVITPPPPLPPQGVEYKVDTILILGSASHTYGQTPNAQFGYSLQGGAIIDDVIDGSAVTFTPTISRLTSAGSFTVSYLSGLSSSLSSSFIPGVGLTYTVNPALLTLSLAGVTANSKVYDGFTAATFSGGSLVGLVNNDAVSFTLAGTFADRHAATAKTVTLSGATLGGAAASNYILAPVSGSYTANITPNPRVAWVGDPLTSDGLWSNPANWAGGALPDRSNVLAVEIPAGARVKYDIDVIGTTSLQRLESSGQLWMAAGSLEVGDALTTFGFSQTDGTLTGPCSFTVTDSFSKTGGLFTTSGPIRVNQTQGNLLFIHDSPVMVYRLTAPNGSVTLINTGATTITGEGILASGDVSAKALSPLTIDGPIKSTSGGVSLTASYPGQLTLNPTATFSAPGAIALAGTGPIVGTLPAGAVVFDNSGCILNPSSCNITPPPETQSAIDNALVQININQQSVIDTTVINSTKPIDLLARNDAGSTSGSGQPSGDPNADKKPDEKETITAKDSGAKKDEPVRKMYCN
jgi:hypothetical protein